MRPPWVVLRRRASRPAGPSGRLWRSHHGAAAGGIILAAISSGPAGAQPSASDTLADLGQALTACFAAPAGSAGSELTVQLTLTRDGAVLGRPRITYSHLLGPAPLRDAFVAAALGSLKACTPVSVTPGLGGAIAGRPFSIRFRGGSPGQPV